jgi:hypothetical protein
LNLFFKAKFKAAPNFMIYSLSKNEN